MNDSNIWTLEKRVYGKQLAGRITAASLRALQNNPGSPAGFKKRRCAKSQKVSVSDETVQLMKDLADNNSPDFRDAMVSDLTFWPCLTLFDRSNQTLTGILGSFIRFDHRILG